MTVTIRLPGQLRGYAGGAATITFDRVTRDTTVAAVLADLDVRFPAVGRRVVDEQGRIRRHVHVFVGDDLARSTAASVPDGVELTIMPAVSGG